MHRPRQSTPEAADFERITSARLFEHLLALFVGHDSALDYHVCFGTNGNLRVSEIWDSQEQLDAFGEQLMPVLSEVGIPDPGEPEVMEFTASS